MMRESKTLFGLAAAIFSCAACRFEVSPIDVKGSPSESLPADAGGTKDAAAIDHDLGGDDMAQPSSSVHDFATPPPPPDLTPPPQGCANTCAVCGTGGCCNDSCKNAGSCMQGCSGCNCNLSCKNSPSCVFNCDGKSNCVAQTKNGAQTVLNCVNMSTCELDCDKETTCVANCNADTTCVVRCGMAQSCSINCVGTKTDCGNGILVCNGPCPP